MTEDFFGYGTCSSTYDCRRHINVIFQLLLMYKLKSNPNVLVPQLRNILSMPTQQAAEKVCNDILSYDEHNYLNLLRERYHLPELDFVKIMSAYGCTLRENKTPAGYSKRQNQELLIQMLNSRYYMQPQNAEAFAYINGVIAVWAGGMQGISMSPQEFQKYDSLWRKALSIYKTNYDLHNIEDYIINNI